MMRIPLLVAGALIAGWIALPVSAIADDTAAALLAKHTAYVGWQFGDGTFKTMRFVTHGTSSSGALVSAESTVETGPIYRTQARVSGGLSYDAGYTGQVFWESDENGFTRPDYSDHRKFEISQYALFNEGTAQLTGTMQSQATIDGTAYSVVRVQPANGDAIDLYVDPQTGAYRRAVIDPTGSYETTYEIKNYADGLPGKRYISEYRVGETDYKVTRFEPNGTVDPSDFHPPAQQASWDFSNSAPFHVDVKPHAIFINATVNGVPGRFILDTGAFDIVLTNAFADRAHLSTLTTGETSGFGSDTLKTRYRRVDKFVIGGNTLSNVIVATGALDILEDDERVDGLIGFPLMAGAIVRLSTADRTMTISDPATANIDRSAGIPIQVDLSDQQPIVPMVIDGRVTVNAVLDSGDGGTVAMAPQLVSKRHIPMLASNNAYLSRDDPDSGTAVESYIQSHIEVTGVGGTELESCSTVSSIALGPINYQGTYACTSPSIAGDNIIVGYDFLKNFDMLFDYHDGILILKPHAQ
jgi:predicted aspartyl protease